MLSTMYRCCVAVFSSGLWEHSHIRRSGSGRPRSTDARQDRHMLHLLSSRIIGNRLLAAELDHVCLWPGFHLHHDTVKHGYSGILEKSTGEWNGALLSSVTRVGCLPVALPFPFIVRFTIMVIVLKDTASCRVAKRIAPSLSLLKGPSLKIRKSTTFTQRFGKPLTPVLSLPCMDRLQ